MCIFSFIKITVHDITFVNIKLQKKQCMEALSILFYGTVLRIIPLASIP